MRSSGRGTAAISLLVSADPLVADIQIKFILMKGSNSVQGIDPK